MQYISPNVVLELARTLDAQTLKVWLILRTTANEALEWSMPQATLAEMIGSSVTTIGRTFRDLRDRGLLAVLRETHRETVYKVQEPQIEARMEPTNPPAITAQPPAPAQKSLENRPTTPRGGSVLHNLSSSTGVPRTVQAVGQARVSGQPLVSDHPRVSDQPTMSDQPKMVDHPKMIGQKRLITQKCSVINDGSPKNDRSFSTDHAPSAPFVSSSSEKDKNKNTTTTSSSDAGACEGSPTGGGGGGSLTGWEGYQALEGLKSTKTRRQLSQQFPPEVILTAVAMAKECRGVNDVAAVAVSFLRDGSATAETARRAAKKAKAATNIQTAVQFKAASEAAKEATHNADAANRATIDNASDADFEAVWEAVKRDMPPRLYASSERMADAQAKRLNVPMTPRLWAKTALCCEETAKRLKARQGELP